MLGNETMISQPFFSNYFPEILHWLCHSSQATGTLHAKGNGQLQVQSVAGCGLNPIWVLHHDSHRSEHNSTHDESKINLLFLHFTNCKQIHHKSFGISSLHHFLNLFLWRKTNKQPPGDRPLELIPDCSVKNSTFPHNQDFLYSSDSFSWCFPPSTKWNKDVCWHWIVCLHHAKSTFWLWY